MPNERKHASHRSRACHAGSGCRCGPAATQKNGDAPAEQAKNPLLEKQAKDLTQQYEQGKKHFSAARDRASAVLVGRFDTALKKVRTATGSPADLRRAKVKTLTEEKSAFMANNTLPTSDEMLGPLLEYHEALHKARLPVAQIYEKLFNLYSVKLKDDSRAEQLTVDKEAFDQKSRGGTVFQRSNWAGFQSGKNNIPFILNVGTLEGSSIKGRIVQDRYPNETIFKVEGLLSGNRIQLKSTQVVQGKTRALIFTGYVMENRILGQVVSVATNGKASMPSIVLMNKR